MRLRLARENRASEPDGRIEWSVRRVQEALGKHCCCFVSEVLGRRPFWPPNALSLCSSATHAVQFAEPLMNKIANRFRRWLTLAVLGLLCWSTTPLTGQAVEVRYNVVKIIEGTGTSVPEAGGINQKGVVVGSMDTFGGSGFWLWSNGVRHDLPLGTNRNCYVKGLNNQGQVVGSFHTG